MKKIARSVADGLFVLQFGVGLEVREGSIRFYTYKADGSTIDSRTYDFPSPPLAAKELSARDNIYVVADSFGKIDPFYNKMAESFGVKASGYDHARKLDKHVIGQIYIPFRDAQISECSVRITYGEEIGYQSNVEIKEVVKDYAAFFSLVSPTLKAVATDSGDIEVSLVNSQAKPIRREGVKIYAKTDGGFLPFVERLTNADGKALFRYMPLGLVSGETVTVEFGFKWSSNLARIEMVA
jgi:hypothetical protein